MESLYFYFITKSLHPGLAQLLSYAVPAFSLGLACVASVIFGMTFRTSFRWVQAVVTYLVKTSWNLVNAVRVNARSAFQLRPRKKAQQLSIKAGDADSKWLKYDEAPFLRGVMVTKESKETENVLSE